ncbi:unnamed protein product [Angiostrongylus costaricensis]|uniref:Neur_chan_memb domain-containing protein n=1 Tax=Angiostrongylus costaricensis TaxID=334426 RepID=A0A0R3PHR3_ANGCS|nr:unnamed protein product [Angiostrongylus costaricensis]
MYSTTVCLQAPVFSLTDIRYKPVVVLVDACLSLTWILFVWGEDIVQMRLMQLTFDIISCCCLRFFITLALSSAASRSGQREAQSESVESRLNEDLRNKPKLEMRNYFVSVLESFKLFKNVMAVLKWSSRWALTSCGTFQVLSFAR